MHYLIVQSQGILSLFFFCFSHLLPTFVQWLLSICCLLCIFEYAIMGVFHAESSKWTDDLGVAFSIEMWPQALYLYLLHVLCEELSLICSDHSSLVIMKCSWQHSQSRWTRMHGKFWACFFEHLLRSSQGADSWDAEGFICRQIRIETGIGIEIANSNKETAVHSKGYLQLLLLLTWLGRIQHHLGHAREKPT